MFAAGLMTWRRTLNKRTSLLARRASGKVNSSILGSISQAANIESLWPQLREAIKIDPKTLIVIDDDPTGCQTVYDVNVLLDYSANAILKQMEKNHRMFYILTNTRGLPEPEAVSITSQVIANIYRAQFDIAARMGQTRSIQIISRSDSTLRGHYPAETQAILESSPEVYDATILVPAFFEGGRLTFGDVHYVTEGESLIPVAETPFARDPHFGFEESNLKKWVQEKWNVHNVEIDPSSIVSITLEDIRQGGEMHVADKLESLQHGSTVIVNAVHQHDLNTFVMGCMHAESNGFNFLYRTAASFVASRAGLEPRALLTIGGRGASEPVVLVVGGSAGSTGSGGLVVVGSYVPKSTAQLQKVLAANLPGVVAIEVDVGSFLKSVSAAQSRTPSPIPIPNPPPNAQSLAQAIDKHTSAGRHVILYTSRAFFSGAGLDQTALVSKLLTDAVNNLRNPPAYLLAKGGVTSHDLAARGLGASVCEVAGQVEPGVPLWRMGGESKFPNMPYVVFPGNVGDDEALLRVLRRLGVGATTTPQAADATSFLYKAHTSKLLNTLNEARASKKAIAAFNVYNLEGAKAAVAVAEHHRAPVMLQVHPSSLEFGGVPLLCMLAAFKASAKVPVWIHLDHATDEKQVLMALESGYVDSVMVDGSAMPFEDNLKWTTKMAAIAHSFGCAVEAELGRLVGEEDGLSVDAKEGKMTDPAVVARFVSESKVDLLAVTIGNVHGKYKHPPQLDLPRLRAIRTAVELLPPSTGHDSGPIKLVLHGASGLPQDLVRQAMALGVCKFNVNTDLREAALDAMQRAFSQEVVDQGIRPDILPIMRQTTEKMGLAVRDKLKLFGWSSKS